jgi:hypothetical protein
MQQNIAMGMTPAEAAAQIAGSASYAPAAAANIPASIASPTAAQMAATNAAVPPQTMTQGLKSLIQDAPGSRAAFMKEVGGATGLASKAAMAAAPLAGDLFSDEEPDTGGKKPQEYVRPYSFDFKDLPKLILSLNTVLVLLGSQLQSNVTLRQSSRDLVSTKLARNRGQVSMARQLQNN